MPIIRSKSEDEEDFAYIPTEALQDSSLSFKAKGMLAYILSTKIEDGYDLIIKGLHGKEYVASGLKELIDKSYLPPYVRVRRQAYIKGQIPKELRWEIWERDDFTCQVCGVRRFLSVDHIIPESKGGQCVAENLRTLCEKCNSRKGAHFE